MPKARCKWVKKFCLQPKNSCYTWKKVAKLIFISNSDPQKYHTKNDFIICLVNKKLLGRELLGFFGLFVGLSNWYTNSKSSLDMALLKTKRQLRWSARSVQESLQKAISTNPEIFTLVPTMVASQGDTKLNKLADCPKNPGCGTAYLILITVLFSFDLWVTRSLITKLGH